MIVEAVGVVCCWWRDAKTAEFCVMLGIAGNFWRGNLFESCRFLKAAKEEVTIQYSYYLRYIGGPYVAVPAIFRDIFAFCPSTFASKTIARPARSWRPELVS